MKGIWLGGQGYLCACMGLLHITEASQDKQDWFRTIAVGGLVWQKLHHTHLLIQIQHIKDTLYAFVWPKLNPKDLGGLKYELHMEQDNIHTDRHAHEYPVYM